MFFVIRFILHPTKLSSFCMTFGKYIYRIALYVYIMFHYCSRIFIANHTGCVTSISRNHMCVLSNNTAKLPFTHVYDASRCHVTSPGQGFVSRSSWAATLTTQWRRPEHFSSKTLSTSFAQPTYSLPMIFLTQRPSLIRPY